MSGWRVSASPNDDSSYNFRADSEYNPSAYFSAQRSPNFRANTNLTSSTGNSFIQDGQSFLSPNAPPPPKRAFFSPNPMRSRHDARSYSTDTRTFSPLSSSPAATRATSRYVLKLHSDRLLNKLLTSSSKHARICLSKMRTFIM